METLREWCGFVCFGAVGCCAVQLLLPKNGLGRSFSVITTTLFICCLMLPLLNVGSQLSLDTRFLDETILQSELEAKVNEQLCRQVETTVTQLATDCFAERGGRAEKITVQTDISENGSIHIKQVTLVVDKQNVSVGLVVRDVLKQQLDAVVTVETAR